MAGQAVDVGRLESTPAGDPAATADRTDGGDGDGSGRQLDLYFGEITSDPATKVFEYAVLVTSLANEVLTVHANQTTITITSTHGKAGNVRRMLAEIVTFFKSLRPIAEQLSDLQRWHRILSRALVKYLKGRQLGPPPIPLPA